MDEVKPRANPTRSGGVVVLTLVGSILGVVLIGVGPLVDSTAVTLVGIGLAAAAIIGLVVTLWWRREGAVTVGFLGVKVDVPFGSPSSDDDQAEVEQHLTVVQQAYDNRMFIEVPDAVVTGGGIDLRSGDVKAKQQAAREVVEETLRYLDQGQVTDPTVGPWSVDVYQPGDRVEVSAIYDVVGQDGRHRHHQDALVAGTEFPELSDPRAHGFVIRKAAAHMSPRPSFHPHDRVPVSGIYDVVDAHGRYLDHQKVCREGDGFPPFIEPLPAGFEDRMPERYVLHERAVPLDERRGSGGESGG